ncbi:hypothetical protein JAAARDRAFT_52578 [Jaapia argillacea MUCL 33604]|uniref:Uncharacterized protein n=1 Tax=Jaapia argillacea MUCL 33604 TaxID=933084 RepID=A0A067QM80_9AGAM|nr:hypothetical protein JAAARDRAFT_52578 [Jaapia argillacea MUCL 33604]
MAVVKSDIKLRTVVQFVKISSQWRTILYLTLDHPIPPQMEARYPPTDMTSLPYSYTLSPPPPLLDGGMDTPTAKAFSIPATSSIAHPSLPINLPGMAMYLQAVVDESRRSGSDSGMRKLAKLVDMCYPNERVTYGVEGPQEEKSTVGDMFRRVIGRKRPKDRNRNEDTYDLVTPFVADEWG